MLMERMVAGYPVKDVGAAVGFYTGKLGFEVCFRYGTPERYSVVRQGGVEIALTLTREPFVGPATGYVHVKGVEELYERVKRAGVRMESELTVQEYGMWDFSVLDLDGNRLTFGEEVPE